MISLQFLPPFMIFRGWFGNKMVKKWKKYSNSTVIFTSITGWNQKPIFCTSIICKVFWGINFVLIYDYAPSRVRLEVVTWILKVKWYCFRKGYYYCVIYGPVFDICFQPLDVVVNAPLKRLIRNQYYEYVKENLRKPTYGTQKKPEDEVSVSREIIV